MNCCASEPNPPFSSYHHHPQHGFSWVISLNWSLFDGLTSLLIVCLPIICTFCHPISGRWVNHRFSNHGLAPFSLYRISRLLDQIESWEWSVWKGKSFFAACSSVSLTTSLTSFVLTLRFVLDATMVGSLEIFGLGINIILILTRSDSFCHTRQVENVVWTVSQIVTTVVLHLLNFNSSPDAVSLLFRWNLRMCGYVIYATGK